MSKRTITLDVREDIRAGREPFSTIMTAVARLQPAEDLLVIAPFEPKPLFHVLAKQGFRPSSQRLASGDWQVLFSRAEGTPEKTLGVSVTPPSCGSSATQPEAMVDLDARGLEPPQPLVAILEATAGLRPGAMLQARTDRRPVHLYAQLEERGFTAESHEQPDGSFLTHIRHR